jgi:uncharacterized sulfatase
MQMLRRNDTVAIRYNIQSGEDDFEIYNIRTDPKQLKNLDIKEKGQEQQDFYKNRVLALHRPDTSASRPYDLMLMPSVAVEGNIADGLHWSLFEVSSPWLPDIKDLPVVYNGKFDFSVAQNYGIKGIGVIYAEGYFYADSDGEYKFNLKTNVPIILKMHEINLFNQDYSFEKNQTYNQRILLQKGWHPFRIYYRNNGSENLPFQVTFSNPKMQEMKPLVQANFSSK